MSENPFDPNMPDLPSRAESKADTRRSLLAQFSSVLALAISFLALATGAYQTRLMQAQARASVWPYVAIGVSYFGAGEKAGFTWQVDNNGVGPAVIKSVDVSLDDKPMRNWDEIFRAMFGHGREHATMSNINGNVLPPNTNRETTIQAIRVTQAEDAKAFFEARRRFKINVCYCSVYDECWIAQWQLHEVKPVERCQVDNTLQFED